MAAASSPWLVIAARCRRNATSIRYSDTGAREAGCRDTQPPGSDSNSRGRKSRSLSDHDAGFSVNYHLPLVKTSPSCRPESAPLIVDAAHLSHYLQLLTSAFSHQLFPKAVLSVMSSSRTLLEMSRFVMAVLKQSAVSARRFWQAVAFGSFSGSSFRLFLFSVPFFTSTDHQRRFTPN